MSTVFWSPLDLLFFSSFLLDILPSLERLKSPCGLPLIQASVEPSSLEICSSLRFLRDHWAVIIQRPFCPVSPVWPSWGDPIESGFWLCCCVIPVLPPWFLEKGTWESFGFQGSSEETRARPELWWRGGPAWTALGQSGVRTRPFSPTLPVMDRRALFLMASVKVSWEEKQRTELWSCWTPGVSADRSFSLWRSSITAEFTLVTKVTWPGHDQIQLLCNPPDVTEEIFKDVANALQPMAQSKTLVHNSDPPTPDLKTLFLTPEGGKTDPGQQV